jgi:uncharacterized membrane protein
MTNQPVVLAVATYAATADADHDFDSACRVGREGKLERVAAAVLEKGADGRLEIRHYDSTAEHLAFPGALLGGAITVIAPPLGIAFLAPVLPTRAAWAAVGAIVAHFWHHIPRDTLRRLSDLLESGQAALVVVAVNHTGDQVAALLTQPTDKIVNDCTRADVEADLAADLAAALAASSAAAQPLPEPHRGGGSMLPH